jgi:perosamine synthetase
VRPNCEEVRWAYAFELDLARLSVPGQKVVEALRAEGVDCFLGYPGQVPLYKYPMLRESLTFGTSGWPFTLPDVVTKQDYGSVLCPLAEAACLNTVVLWWTERISEAEARLIGSAIRKVVGSYEV